MKNNIALLSLSILFLAGCGQVTENNPIQTSIETGSINVIQADATTIEGLKDYNCGVMCNTNIESGIIQAEYSKFTSPELGITFSFMSSGDSIVNTVIRNGNVICVLANGQNMRSDKMGCIEIVNDTNNLTLSTNGTATLETLTGENIQYIKYSCDGCAPIDEVSRANTIKKI